MEKQTDLKGADEGICSYFSGIVHLQRRHGIYDSALLPMNNSVQPKGHTTEAKHQGISLPRPVDIFQVCFKQTPSKFIFRSAHEHKAIRYTLIRE